MPAVELSTYRMYYPFFVLRYMVRYFCTPVFLGANIHDALVSAATQFIDSDMPSNVILFLTDSTPNIGETRTDVIVAEVSRAIGGKSTPFFVSFGDDVDTLLLRNLSKTNGGMHQNIKDDPNIEIKILEFFNQVTMSVLTDVKIKFRPSAAIQRNTLTNIDYSRLSMGTEIVRAGKLSNNFHDGFLTVGITGKSAAGNVRSTKRYDIVHVRT